MLLEEITKPTHLDYETIAHRLVDMAERDGGFTVKPNTFEDAGLNTGFMVAIEGFETRANMNDVNKMIRALISINRAVNAENDHNLYVGGWVADGKLCLDVSEHIMELDAAMEAGKERNQDAIFNCRSKEEIPLK